MKKIFSLIVGCILTCHVAYSQDILYSEVSQNKISIGAMLNSVVMVDGKYPLVYITELSGMKTTKGSLIQVKEKGEKYDFGVPYKKTYSKGVTYFNGTLYRLLLTKDKETRSMTQRVVSYSKKGEPLQVIDESEVKYKKYKDFPKTSFIISQDSNYIAIIKLVDVDKKNSDLRLDIEVYDKEFKKIHSKQWSPSGKDGQRMNHVMGYEIDNFGNVLILVKKYKEKYKESAKKNKKAVNNYDFVVMKYLKEGGVEEYKIDIKDYFTDNTFLTFYEDGTPIIISSIKSSSYEDASTIGYQFHIWNDNSFKSIDHFWTESEINEFGKWKKQKVDGLRKWFYILSTKAHGDKLTFLVENRWFDWRRNYNSKYQVAVHGCVLTFTIDKEGNKVDHMFIPRYVENGITLQSPILHIVNDKPVVIYNDDYKNSNKSISKLREKLLRLKRNIPSGDPIIAVAFRNNEGEFAIEEIPDTKNHYLYGKQNSILNDKNVGIVSKHYRGLLKKSLLKYATFDFSEFN